MDPTDATLKGLGMGDTGSPGFCVETGRGLRGQLHHVSRSQPPPTHFHLPKIQNSDMTGGGGSCSAASVLVFHSWENKAQEERGSESPWDEGPQEARKAGSRPLEH